MDRFLVCVAQWTVLVQPGLRVLSESMIPRVPNIFLRDHLPPPRASTINPGKARARKSSPEQSMLPYAEYLQSQPQSHMLQSNHTNCQSNFQRNKGTEVAHHVDGVQEAHSGSEILCIFILEDVIADSLLASNLECSSHLALSRKKFNRMKVARDVAMQLGQVQEHNQ